MLEANNVCVHFCVHTFEGLNTNDHRLNTLTFYCGFLIVPLQVGSIVRTSNMRNGANKESMFFFVNGTHTAHLWELSVTHSTVLNSRWKTHLHNKSPVGC